MKVLRYPIFGITCFFVSGILVDFYGKPDTTVLFLSLIVTFVAFCLSYFAAKRHFIQRNYFGIFVYLLSFLIGCATQHLYYAPNHVRHYSRYITDGSCSISGTINERLKSNAIADKYLFEVSKINDHVANGTLLLYIPKTVVFPKPIIGTELTTYSTISQLPKNKNPYQFDYAAYMEKRNVFHQIQLSEINYIITGHSRTISSQISTYRDRLLTGFEKHHFKPEVQTLINALVLGQRQDLDKNTSSSYTDAGAAHILAISGLHIAILYGMLVFITRPLKRLKNGSLLLFVIPLLFLWLYALLTGLSASVVRAVTMFSLIGFSRYLNRDSSLYNTLIISFFLLLVFKPVFLFDIGFQLSYAAVFAIVALQNNFKMIRLFKNRIVRYLSGILSVSLAAQLGVLPLCLFYFHQIPLLFIVSNLIVLPLTALILALGIAVTILNFISEPVALFLGKLLSFLIETMNASIAQIASYKELIIRDIPFNFYLMIALYIVFVTLYFWIQKKRASQLLFVLTATLLFQTTIWTVLNYSKHTDEFVVFHNRKHTLITLKTGNRMTAYSNDSLIDRNYDLKMYRKGIFYPQTNCETLRNTLFYRDQKILIVDANGVYNISEKPDIILLIHSPKINLERLIQLLHPKLIIADGTNRISDTERWDASCRKTKIPFYATGKKGFLSIANTN